MQTQQYWRGRRGEERRADNRGRRLLVMWYLIHVYDTFGVLFLLSTALFPLLSLLFISFVYHVYLYCFSYVSERRRRRDAWKREMSED
ncbi:hypothetical protein BZA05DRAFT_391512 [Tricharina praecox]|uniref:uncharacterized protein n=1 Tax=Tricharina praecox TaxID=43433 RepID=UPI0022210AC7|nr:uncharacterized protein BZA05DRAFT_391512 [Tricharina praecox]KAI5855421.1 hypothetical protein BZA05DRAFT_391512 [Tricharina praecox]